MARVDRDQAKATAGDRDPVACDTSNMAVSRTIRRSIDVSGVVAEYRADDPIYLLDLADGWAQHVLRFIAEAGSQETPPDFWGGDDFIGALHLRSRLEEALRGEPIDLPTVAAVDELFRRFTKSDDDAWLQRSGHEIPSEPWWWQRVPAAGPAAKEMAGWSPLSQ
jgi:hypothetical protein